MTPARYVEQVRVEAARRRLEESANGVDAIADACGFGTAETMRRAFLRIVRVPRRLPRPLPLRRSPRRHEGIRMTIGIVLFDDAEGA